MPLRRDCGERRRGVGGALVHRPRRRRRRHTLPADLRRHSRVPVRRSLVMRLLPSHVLVGNLLHPQATSGGASLQGDNPPPKRPREFPLRRVPCCALRVTRFALGFCRPHNHREEANGRDEHGHRAYRDGLQIPLPRDPRSDLGQPLLHRATCSTISPAQAGPRAHITRSQCSTGWPRMNGPASMSVRQTGLA